MSEVRVKAKVTPRPTEGQRIRVRDRYRAMGRISTPNTLVNAHTEMSVLLVTEFSMGSLWEWLAL